MVRRAGSASAPTETCQQTTRVPQQTDNVLKTSGSAAMASASPSPGFVTESLTVGTTRTRTTSSAGRSARTTSSSAATGSATSTTTVATGATSMIALRQPAVTRSSAA